MFAGMVVPPGNGAEQALVKQAPTIPELYTRTIATEPDSTYDSSSFVPQVGTIAAQPLAAIETCAEGTYVCGFCSGLRSVREYKIATGSTADVRNI